MSSQFDSERPLGRQHADRTWGRPDRRVMSPPGPPVAVPGLSSFRQPQQAHVTRSPRARLTQTSTRSVTAAQLPACRLHDAAQRWHAQADGRHCHLQHFISRKRHTVVFKTRPGATEKCHPFVLAFPGPASPGSHSDVPTESDGAAGTEMSSGESWLQAEQEKERTFRKEGGDGKIVEVM